MPLKSFKARLVPEIKELNIFAKKDLLTTAMSGELTSSLKGHGIEFEDYRDYTTADDATRIDWRASKRAQRTLVREYKMDVALNIFFLVDVSESMLFGSTAKLKCEYQAEIIASLFFGLLRSGDAVGFGLFNDKLFQVTKPKLSQKQFYIFTKEIQTPTNYGGKKNIGKALEQAMGVLSRKSLIIMFSDFLGIDDRFAEFLKVGSQRHELIGIMIRDPRDNQLPSNNLQMVVGDPFSKQKLYVDAKDYAKVYEQEVNKEKRILRAMFERTRTGLLELRTDQSPMNPLLQFMKKRGNKSR